MEKTIWILLNFYTFLKYYVKCTRGFIQRKMRWRLENLSEVLQKARFGEDRDYKNAQDLPPENETTGYIFIHAEGGLNQQPIAGREQAVLEFAPWRRSL